MTGATGGIGRAISELFLAEGATVHLTDLDPERGASLAATLGDRARFHVLDVTDEAGWADVTERIEESDGPLTTLVNCAGAALRRPLVDTSLSDFRRLVELNLTGTFLGIRTAGQHLADGGSVVNISSLNGVLPTAELGAYVASKAAVSALTRVAALEFADRGITVNAVCPGSIDTEITDRPDFAGRRLGRLRADHPAEPARRRRRGGPGRPLPRLGREPLRDRDQPGHRRRHRRRATGDLRPGRQSSMSVIARSGHEPAALRASSTWSSGTSMICPRTVTKPSSSSSSSRSGATV